MNDSFIRNIEIKNFKCFEDFSAEGFGRVNLIGGKNNIGKTAFMEAAWINVFSKSTNSLYTAIAAITFMRNNMENICKNCSAWNEFFENIKRYTSKSNINTIDYQLINKNGKKEYSFKINNENNIINANEFSYQIEDSANVKYIDNFGYTNQQLKEAFESVQKKDAEETLYKYINDFDENILNFKVIGGDKPQCKIQNGTYIDINEFGDGLKHWVSIISSLYACEDGYLFIDEIDNGVHYTQLDKLWNIVFALSKKYNVQVFATTHSKECIESFNRMQKKPKYDDTYYFEMAKNAKTEEIFMTQIDGEQLEYELRNNESIRGE